MRESRSECEEGKKAAQLWSHERREGGVAEEGDAG